MKGMYTEKELEELWLEEVGRCDGLVEDPMLDH
jgi:hypothetical protein